MNKNIENIDIFEELENIEDFLITKREKIGDSIYETIEYTYYTKSPDSIVIKKRNTILSGIIFLTKYVFTSAMIFAVLLIATNYSAYINIAKSYVYASELKENQQKLISSVEASDISEKILDEIKDDTLEKKEDEEVINEGKLSIKKLKKQQNKKDINLNIEITPYENRVVIPKIGQNIPLVDIKNRNINGEDELNDIFMDELENGIIRYPGSAKPGEDGTSFIFGHSSNFPWIKGDYNDVFSLLDNVVYDDTIIVYYGQKKFTYKIKEKKVISPGDVSVLDRNKKKSEITLMTCWPIGTTLNRLIVVGELVEE